MNEQEEPQRSQDTDSSVDIPVRTPLSKYRLVCRRCLTTYDIESPSGVERALDHQDSEISKMLFMGWFIKALN